MQPAFTIKRLVIMLTLLSFLFIAAEFIFLSIHWQVFSLLDAWLKSSLSFAILHSKLMIDIILFISIPLIAHLFLIIAAIFFTHALRDIFGCAPKTTYGLGILMLGLLFFYILLLNNQWYPQSFFAQGFYQFPWYGPLFNLSLLYLFSFSFLLLSINKKARIFLCSCFFILLTLTFFEQIFFQIPAQKNPALPPNIIILSLDSLRPDALSFFGNDQVSTPTLDAFLGSSTVMLDAYTPLARTYPAWISILTGQYPLHTKARMNLVDSTQIVRHENIAERLREAGYETIYASDERRFSAIDQRYGFNQIIGPKSGVLEFLLASVSDFPLTNVMLKLPFAQTLLPYQYGNRAASITYDPKHFLKRLQHGLAYRAVNKPLFLAIHLCLVHWPNRWASDQQAENWHLVKRYQASVIALDQQVSEVLSVLNQAGLINRSLIFLISDHGTGLGQLGDRLITKVNYSGNLKELQRISSYRLSDTPLHTLNFQQDFSINTSYGQGTDLLSLQQHHVLFAVQSHGISFPHKPLSGMVSLLDIAPTVLDFLNLKPLKNPDGMSLLPYLVTNVSVIKESRPLFLESADTIAEIETDDIQMANIIRKRVGAYQINMQTGQVILRPEAYVAAIRSKERAVIWGDWLIARYPGNAHFVFSPVPKTGFLTLKSVREPSYEVVVNLKTKAWTIGREAALAKRAPLELLLAKLHGFYGDEFLVN